MVRWRRASPGTALGGPSHLLVEDWALLAAVVLPLLSLVEHGLDACCGTRQIASDVCEVLFSCGAACSSCFGRADTSLANGVPIVFTDADKEEEAALQKAAEQATLDESSDETPIEPSGKSSGKGGTLRLPSAFGASFANASRRWSKSFGR